MVYLLVELEPGGETFTVHVLKTKEPHLTQTNGLNHLRGEGEIIGIIEHTLIAPDTVTIPYHIRTVSIWNPTHVL